MTGQLSRRGNLVSGTAIRRRQALAGLISGATVTLREPLGKIEAKKKKKKCRKPNRCPQRTCCTCRDPNTFIVVLCDYIAASPNFIGDCFSFCSSQGLTLFQATGDVADQANYCTHSLECVRLDCPVS